MENLTTEKRKFTMDQLFTDGDCVWLTKEDALAEACNAERVMTLEDYLFDKMDEARANVLENL